MVNRWLGANAMRGVGQHQHPIAKRQIMARRRDVHRLRLRDDPGCNLLELKIPPVASEQLGQHALIVGRQVLRDEVGVTPGFRQMGNQRAQSNQSPGR